MDGEGFLLARKWGLIRGGGFRFPPGRGEGGQRLILVGRRVGGEERLKRRQLKGDVMMMRHVRMMRISSMMVGGQPMLHRRHGCLHGGGQVGERHQLGLQRLLLIRLQPEPLPSAQQRTVLKHGDRLGMEGPVGAFAGPGMAPRNLDEAVVEAEIVS